MHYYFFLYAQFHIPLYAGNKYCAFRGQRNKKIDIFGPNMIKHMGSNFSTMHLFAFSLPIKNILNPLKIADAFCLVQKYHKKNPKTKQRKLTSTQTHTHKSLLAIAILCCHIMSSRGVIHPSHCF